MSNNLLALINRLITTVMLVVMLFACQQMPENSIDGTQLQHQTN
ncbi:MAG: hypothetical protein AAF383_21580 [Cyanobacteria bacterium P01_A01_bin.83]